MDSPTSCFMWRTDTVYVVPRGKITHYTSWAEPALEPYKEAWHLPNEASPQLFERKAEAMSDQLQKIIAEATKHDLPYELIRSKRGVSRNDYRKYAQGNNPVPSVIDPPASSARSSIR